MIVWTIRISFEPSGRTKLDTELLTPRFSSAHSIETGNVAEDEDVEKAISCAGRMALRNDLSFILATKYYFS